jgi:hypothetical protein
MNFSILLLNPTSLYSSYGKQTFSGIPPETRNEAQNGFSVTVTLQEIHAYSSINLLKPSGFSTYHQV